MELLPPLSLYLSGFQKKGNSGNSKKQHSIIYNLFIIKIIWCKKPKLKEIDFYCYLLLPPVFIRVSTVTSICYPTVTQLLPQQLCKPTISTTTTYQINLPNSLCVPRPKSMYFCNTLFASSSK